MTRATNARLAGFAFLFYIAVGLASLFLFRGATGAPGTAGKLARIAERAPDVRLVVVLSLLACLSALVLAVTLYALTRDEDRDLAALGMICRVAEGVLGGASIMATVGLLWLATSGRAGLDAAGALPIAGYLLATYDWSPIVSATFFAVGSTLFSWLMLRGRMIPTPLAWLGVAASVLLVVLLPAQLGGLARGLVTQVMWLPMLVFEVVLALWLLVTGAPRPAAR